jgi:hypothetical protein
MSDDNVLRSYIADYTTLHNGETVWVAEPAAISGSDVDFRKLIPTILASNEFPGERLCWMCREQRADLNSTIMKKVTGIESGYTGGRSWVRSVSAFVCVPRCAKCAAIMAGAFSISAIFGVPGLLGIIVSAIASLLRGPARNPDDIRPDWIFQIPWLAIGVVAGISLVLLVAAGVLASIDARRLEKLGLHLEPHPDIAKAQKLVDEMVRRGSR